jgi:hypothetical protein
MAAAEQEEHNDDKQKYVGFLAFSLSAERADPQAARFILER